jgi:hypothetical protein
MTPSLSRRVELTYASSDPNILSKYYALEFNDDKIDQLLYIIKEALKRFLANGIVGLGTN